MASAGLIYLDENEVKKYLDWKEMITAMEENFSDVSSSGKFNDKIILQPPRHIVEVPHRNAVVVTMPGLSERKKAFGCKLVTVFPDNPTKHKMPSILATITLLDPETGRLTGILEATGITEYRTAASSLVAARQLWKPTPNPVLAVLGAGAQAKIHIIAFQQYFKFKKIYLWNRTLENAKKLAADLKKDYNINVEVMPKVEEATPNADVVITAMHTTTPFLKYANVKPNVVVIAVGVGIGVSEIDKSIYDQAEIYVDCMDNAKKELGRLEEEGYHFAGEIGEVINGTKEVNRGNQPIIFHSLGLATEDAVAAQVVLDKYIKANQAKKA